MVGVPSSDAGFRKQHTHDWCPMSHVVQCWQVKRCGEMARKLRFFREQMLKARISPAPRGSAEDGLDLDDLEVKLQNLHVPAMV